MVIVIVIWQMPRPTVNIPTFPRFQAQFTFLIAHLPNRGLNFRYCTSFKQDQSEVPRILIPVTRKNGVDPLGCCCYITTIRLRINMS